MTSLEIKKLGLILDLDGIRMIQRKTLVRDNQKITNQIRLFFDGVLTLDFYLTGIGDPQITNVFSYVLSQEDFEALDLVLDDYVHANDNNRYFGIIAFKEEAKVEGSSS